MSETADTEGRAAAQPDDDDNSARTDEEAGDDLMTTGSSDDGEEEEKKQRVEAARALGGTEEDALEPSPQADIGVTGATGGTAITGH